MERGIVSESVHSMMHAAIQSPIEGAAQLIDHVLDTEIAKRVKFMEDPKPQAFCSPGWAAQQFGSAIGFILPFMLVNKAVRRCYLPDFDDLAKAGKLTPRLIVADAAATGFTYDSLLRPVKPEEGSFWRARLNNGVAGALTFSVLSGTSLALQVWCRPIIRCIQLQARARSRIDCGSTGRFHGRAHAIHSFRQRTC